MIDELLDRTSHETVFAPVWLAKNGRKGTKAHWFNRRPFQDGLLISRCTWSHLQEGEGVEPHPDAKRCEYCNDAFKFEQVPDLPSEGMLDLVQDVNVQLAYRVYRHISEHPGITFEGIAQADTLSTGALIEGMKKAIEMGLIVSTFLREMIEFVSHSFEGEPGLKITSFVLMQRWYPLQTLAIDAPAEQSTS